jgi:hypothetical protein
VPLLEDIALKEGGADAPTVALRRQLAVWSLANLGEKVKHLGDLPPARRDEILTALAGEEASPSPDRSRWARVTRQYLADLPSTGPRAPGVDAALDRCAHAGDPVLRKLTAFALNIWEGDADENARMEQTLLGLSYDDGHGAAEDRRVRGLEVRYKAVEGLARRGSPKVQKRLGVLKEMLDPDQQAKNFRTRLKDGRDVPDDTAVASTVTSGLRAVAELHRKRPGLDLSALRPAVEALAQDPNSYVRNEAEKTQIVLNQP